MRHHMRAQVHGAQSWREAGRTGSCIARGQIMSVEVSHCLWAYSNPTAVMTLRVGEEQLTPFAPCTCANR